MKAIIFILSILFITNSNAQKFDCASKTKEYQDAFKIKKITEAFDTWTVVVKNCPKTSETIYKDGIQIFQYKIANAKTNEEKEWIREAMKLYNRYNVNFPETTKDFEVSKAMLMYDNSLKADQQLEEIINLLENGFTNAPKSITNAKAIYTYFRLYFDKYKAGDKKITPEVILDKFTLVNAMLIDLQISNPTKNTQYKTAQNGIRAMAKDITTCDNLATYYTKKYETNKDNSDWIATALANLSGKCIAKPIFNTLAERLYALQVTAQSAYYIAQVSQKQKKIPEAIQYFTKSAELQTNPTEKAKIYYSLGTGLLAKDFPKSRDYLNKALNFDPKLGKAYLYLAQHYANSADQCGQTDFEKKTIYYLAIQTAKKAGVAEPKLQKASDKLAESFADKALTPSEITKENKNGKSITINCWINETITFPSE